MGCLARPPRPRLPVARNPRPGSPASRSSARRIHPPPHRHRVHPTDPLGQHCGSYAGHLASFCGRQSTTRTLSPNATDSRSPSPIVNWQLSYTRRRSARPQRCGVGARRRPGISPQHRLPASVTPARHRHPAACSRRCPTDSSEDFPLDCHVLTRSISVGRAGFPVHCVRTPSVHHP